MKSSRDKAYLLHIRDAINQIKEYLEGVDYEKFENTQLLVDGAVRQLSIIGEAANRLSDELKSNYPEIPFRDIVDMRNILIHEYFGVDKKTVWNVCQNNLADLERMLKREIG